MASPLLWNTQTAQLILTMFLTYPISASTLYSSLGLTGSVLELQPKITLSDPADQAALPMALTELIRSLCAGISHTGSSSTGSKITSLPRSVPAHTYPSTCSRQVTASLVLCLSVVPSSLSTLPFLSPSFHLNTDPSLLPVQICGGSSSDSERHWIAHRMAPWWWALCDTSMASSSHTLTTKSMLPVITLASAAPLTFTMQKISAVCPTTLVNTFLVSVSYKMTFPLPEDTQSTLPTHSTAWIISFLSLSSGMKVSNLPNLQSHLSTAPFLCVANNAEASSSKDTVFTPWSSFPRESDTVAHSRSSEGMGGGAAEGAGLRFITACPLSDFISLGGSGGWGGTLGLPRPACVSPRLSLSQLPSTAQTWGDSGLGFEKKKKAGNFLFSSRGGRKDEGAHNRKLFRKSCLAWKTTVFPPRELLG